MNYRERRERRAERLKGWAEKRRAKSDAAYERARVVADGIPLGQPILIGHHSEKRHRRDIDRIDSGMRQGHEHAQKAADMTSRAGGIENQLERSIYRDDVDAVEQLERRIATLEATRTRHKAINAEIRKGAGWEARLRDAGCPLTEAEIADLASHARHLGGVGYPSYHFQNLGGNINRQRKRLPQLRALAAQRARVRETLDQERAADDMETCSAEINQDAPPIAEVPFSLTAPVSRATDALAEALPWDRADYQDEEADRDHQDGRPGNVD